MSIKETKVCVYLGLIYFQLPQTLRKLVMKGKIPQITAIACSSNSVRVRIFIAFGVTVLHNFLLCLTVEVTNSNDQVSDFS